MAFNNNTDLSRKKSVDNYLIPKTIGNTFTLTFPYRVKLNYFAVELITSAVVGNRVYRLEIYDTATGTFAQRIASSVIVAPSTTRFYQWMTDTARDTIVIFSNVIVPLTPNLIIETSMTLNFLESANVDPAGDTYEVNYQLERM